MVISKGSIFTLVVSVALAFAVNAFAGNQPKENLEAVVQIHAQVGTLESMSELYNDFKSDKDMFRKDLATANCKEIRGDDPQCEADGTEPILAGLEYSFARNSGALIPKGMDLKKGDLVTEESYLTENRFRIIAKKHEKGDCEWTHPFKLAGSGRVECKDDEANDFEDSIFLLKRHPLKHLPESTATHEDGTPLTKLEQYRLKTVASVTEPTEELLVAVPYDVEVKPLDDAPATVEMTEQTSSIEPMESIAPIEEVKPLSPVEAKMP